MPGHKSRPKKDKAVKVCGGSIVKTGQIIVRGIELYKAGNNVRGLGTLYAMCPGKVHFSRKKNIRGVVKTYVNVIAQEKGQ